MQPLIARILRNALILTAWLACTSAARAVDTEADCQDAYYECTASCRRQKDMSDSITSAILARQGVKVDPNAKRLSDALQGDPCGERCTGDRNACVASVRKAQQEQAKRQEQERQARQAQQQATQRQAVQAAEKEKVANAKADKVKAWLAEGWDLFNKDRKYLDALDFFQAVIKADANNSEGWFWAMRCHEALNQRDQALVHAAKYVQLEPDDPRSAAIRRRYPKMDEELVQAQLKADKARFAALSAAVQRTRTQVATLASAQDQDAAWQTLLSDQATEWAAYPEARELKLGVENERAQLRSRLGLEAFKRTETAATADPSRGRELWRSFQRDWTSDLAKTDVGRVMLDEAAKGSGRACAECPETVMLQPGSFQMGSPRQEQGRDDGEGPVHQVRIGYRFEVGKTHVTKAEFEAFVTATGYRTEAEAGDGCFGWTGSKWEKRSDFSWRNVGFAQANDHPVVCLSWNDTQKYVAWLNERSMGKGWRLMTEAEWEYAARAGTTTRSYWGDDSEYSQRCAYANGADQSANRVWNAQKVDQCDDGYAYTSPVGRLKANAWGLHDMAGNAWQWTQDCYAKSYEGAPTDGSALQSAGCELRVLRGGSWGVDPQRLRSAYRGRNSPAVRIDGSGFRLARTVF